MQTAWKDYQQQHEQRFLDEMLELTNGDQACAPVVHGQFIEAHCRVYGLGIGVISSTIKTHLKDIQWV